MSRQTEPNDHDTVRLPPMLQQLAKDFKRGPGGLGMLDPDLARWRRELGALPQAEHKAYAVGLLAIACKLRRLSPELALVEKAIRQLAVLAADVLGEKATARDIIDSQPPKSVQAPESKGLGGGLAPPAGKKSGARRR